MSAGTLGPEVYSMGKLVEPRAAEASPGRSAGSSTRDWSAECGGNRRNKYWT